MTPPQPSSEVPADSPLEKTGRRVAIIQSGYLPWKGHFDIIHDVDLFVFLDDVQFTLRDWRTRNRLKTPKGSAWLTVPVGSHRDLCIDEVRIPDPGWQERHWSTLRHTYSRAPFFHLYRDFFEEIYLGTTWESLSRLNQHLTVGLAREFLGIRTEFMDARPLATHGCKTPRLLQILEQCGAQVYITGPTTRSYLDVDLLAEAGIQAIFKNFDGYPEYRQLHQPFDHFVSVVDLLFNTGPEAPWYIWGWREDSSRRKAP